MFQDNTARFASVKGIGAKVPVTITFSGSAMTGWLVGGCCESTGPATSSKEIANKLVAVNLLSVFRTGNQAHWIAQEMYKPARRGTHSHEKILNHIGKFCEHQGQTVCLRSPSSEERLLSISSFEGTPSKRRLGRDLNKKKPKKFNGRHSQYPGTGMLNSTANRARTSDCAEQESETARM